MTILTLKSTILLPVQTERKKANSSLNKHASKAHNYSIRNDSARKNRKEKCKSCKTI